MSNAKKHKKKKNCRMITFPIGLKVWAGIITTETILIFIDKNIKKIMLRCTWMKCWLRLKAHGSKISLMESFSMIKHLCVEQK